MTTITRDLVKAMRQDINKALESIAKQYGVSITAGNATFDREGTEATYKLVVLADADKTIDDARKQKLADGLEIARMYHPDLDPNKTFKLASGRSVKVIGYNTRARKMPFIVQDVNSTDKYKCSAHSLGLEPGDML